MASNYLLPDNTSPATTTQPGVVKIGSGINVTSDGTISLNSTGVTAGTYTKVTVDVDGRITTGANPTTIAGYGITDAVTKVNPTMSGVSTLTSNVTKASGSSSTNVFLIKSSDNQALFEVRENGDTVIAGKLTVNSTGSSFAGNTTFEGDVSIGGNLNVAGTSNVTADLAGDDLTLTGNLVVKGNTFLGDDPLVDTTTIKGLTNVVSKTTKALGNATDNVFKVTDSAGADLFNVKTNGDTVIAGVLTVNGTGDSTFAGNVSIGGKLTVADTASASAALAGTDLTLSGNLVVNGNTTLGDNAATDVININGVTTIKSKSTKAAGDANSNVFLIKSSDNQQLFEVRENGDTVIAGKLTVNSTGSSFAGNTTFEGDVSIGGNLNVAGTATAQADLSGNDLSLQGNLIVRGNTSLGDSASSDTTTIKGVTTIVSKITKQGGSPSNDVFVIVDATEASPQTLFAVKENGDTVIGGVLTVNGTGTSTFAGDVTIGGALTVHEGASVAADMTGDNLTLTGNLVVNGNTTLGNAPEIDELTINGKTTFNGTVKLSVDPVDALEAATKQYVDNIVLGLDVKQSVRAATTANITLSGIPPAASVDGITLMDGNRVLVKSQSNAAENGIYVVNGSGSWLRSADANLAGKVSSGMYVWIEQGTNLADSGWILTVDDTVTLGSTPLVFVQFSGAGQVIAGDGLSKSGNTISANIGTGLYFDPTTRAITVSATSVGAISSSDATVEPTPDKIVKRDAQGNMFGKGLGLDGKVSKVNNVATVGNFGVATITANASDVSLTSTSTVNIATFTPTIQGNCLVYLYFRVVTASTQIKIEVNYSDGSGPQKQIIVDGIQAVGSYSVSPLFINATAGTPVSVNATAGTASRIYISANIAGM